MKEKLQEPLEHRVLRFIQEHNLIPKQQKLVVAVSGGPDSVCLLHILVNIQKELEIELHIAHLNHQLRGAESEADAHYVAELARQWNIPATIESRDVKAYQREKHISLEEAAREVRYAFLAQVADSSGTSRVAVGHTCDDHIETVLIHLIRGSGTKGLRGLQPISRWQSPSLTVIRPLLEVSREETAEYCAQHKLAPRIDTSNLSLSPLRNRIRQQLLPLLQSYNPRVTEALIRTARIAEDDLAFIDEESRQGWEKVARQEGNTVIFDRQKFLELPPALKRHLLRLAIEKLAGNIKDFEMCHIEDMLEALTKPVGKKLILPAGLVFSVDYTQYMLSSEPSPIVPLPALEGEHPLKVPGETLIPGWRIEAKITTKEEMKETDSFAAHFDFAKTGDKLVARSRRRGDRFQPLGMSQPKKLGEFMIDAKIPHAWRERIPIVCSPEQIIWVAGWRIDERAKVNKATKRVLLLKMEKAE